MDFERPHRIAIETRSTTKDAMGGQSETWSLLGVFYASVRPLTGRALEAAQAIQSEVTHEIRMLYDSRITAAHRVKFKNRLFEIRSVINPGEACEELRLSAAEGLSEG